MKNKIITEQHMNYINDIVTIIGFNNLGDFNKIIKYTTLKLSCNKICSFNITIYKDVNNNVNSLIKKSIANKLQQNQIKIAHKFIFIYN